jgi:hypothetical protein
MNGEANRHMTMLKYALCLSAFFIFFNVLYFYSVEKIVGGDFMNRFNGIFFWMAHPLQNADLKVPVDGFVHIIFV